MTEDLSDYEFQIPNLAEYSYERKSDPDGRYNCIAWAAGEKSRLWWPPLHIGSIEYWPPGVPAWESLPAFVKAFEAIGYSECDSTDPEPGLEKIAIFVSRRTGKPTHASRQLASGRWTSKLGAGIDIEHDDLRAVGGEERLAYGQVEAVLARRSELGGK